MNYIVLAYSIYLPVAVLLTIWVARTLHSNSRVFLVDIFHGENLLANSVNKLLQLGFYLVTLGFAIVRLEIRPEYLYDNATGQNVYREVDSVQTLMEVLSHKLGAFILVLGIVLFINLFMLLVLRAGTRPAKSNFTAPHDIIANH